MKKEIRAIILFNERVDRLDRSSLSERMENPHYKLDYERMIKRQWVSVDGVTEDIVDAFVLNLRLLIQNNDGFSIHSLAKDVYENRNINVPEEMRERFSEQRHKWHEHMDRPSVFKHLTEERNLTNHELFYVLLYGGLAHVNRKKVDLFYALARQGAYSSLVCTSFLSSLSIFLGVVRAIREINKELMEHWKC
jgi:hypothetical protein